MALQLRRNGIQRVRPLAGGLDGWRERGYPIVAAEEVSPAAQPAPAVR
ncbi:MAG TPA: hypothetical protein VMV61_13315 [Patescibacteria group bacterium]|nr:hypothetical protein [Patescibacteria group bacterium]